ncbi:M24 family metallopeptidase [Chelativorans xinjiangense]|uniref:M24 family metallopeptidase n=1 Tax=Chelativorans xinjiangense TaxID=2681485 RepID=UPI00135B0EFC|nr:Xaa-Pro peptidase family protein [Chelativorans xinjiangense]
MQAAYSSGTHSSLRKRTADLRAALAEGGLSAAVLADPDSIAYFAGYWNYLGVEFGRPTLLAVFCDRDPVIVTPRMEAEMCTAMTWIQDIRPWSDGAGEEWRGALRSVLGSGLAGRIGIEKRSIPALVANELLPMLADTEIMDVGPLVARMRMVKSADEIAVMRRAGEVAIAMVEGAKEAIGEGAPEYEVALSVIAAGTRKAASFLEDGNDRFVSPTIHNLQILQSGSDTCMVHRRSSVRRMQRGDPVYLCFCGIANFRNYKLGFDREFFVGTVTDEEARVYETAVAAQQAALAAIRPGIACEEVNAAAEEVYRQEGFEAGYRTGRSIGCSFLEPPELKRGEKSVLQPGMTFAVDGGITVSGKFGGRVGDSIVVTEDGFEYLTPYPRDLTII